jgi:hypothetical protein
LLTDEMRDDIAEAAADGNGLHASLRVTPFEDFSIAEYFQAVAIWCDYATKATETARRWHCKN